MSSVLACASFFSIFQVKFRACTAQKSWSPSSPLSKMQPRRTASPGRSTITSPSVSPVSLSTGISVCRPLFFRPFVLVLVGRKFLCAHYCVCFPAVLLYNALQKHRSVSELESAACASNQKATYFKIKHLSSALWNSCSDRPPMFPLCLLVVLLCSICALTGPC